MERKYVGLPSLHNFYNTCKTATRFGCILVYVAIIRLDIGP